MGYFSDLNRILQAGMTTSMTAAQEEPPAPKPKAGTAPQHTSPPAKEPSQSDRQEKEPPQSPQKPAPTEAANDMSDAEVIAASTQRIRTDTEKLTRRNMKDHVSQHIQAKCQAEPAFARRTMQPRKSMLHCFQYINRKARDYLQEEMKAEGTPVNGIYGGDVPDDLCYQWAEDYFNDPEAPEDLEKQTPKPTPASTKSQPKKPAKKKSADTPDQISLLGETG